MAQGQEGKARRQTVAAALLAGFALRALFVWLHPRFVGDTLIYGDLAHNLLAHHRYALTEEGRVRGTLIRLPGYPLFLALCFVLFGTGNFLAVVWVQVLFDLLGCWLLSRVAGRLFGQKAETACLWLTALCPFTANYAAAALTETLSIFSVTVAFWALTWWLDQRKDLAAGAVLGVACCAAVLLRPDGILLAGALLPAAAFAATKGVREGRRWQASLAPLTAATLLLVCLGSWAVRNWHVFHVFQPLAPKYANDPGETTPAGFARWYRTWGAGLADTARVYWEYDGSILTMSDLPPWAIDGAAQRRETERVYRDYNAEQGSTPQAEKEFAALARERERAHPFRSFLGLPAIRLGDMWLRPRTELLPHMPLDWWDFQQRPGAALFAAVYGLGNVLLLGCAGLGLWRWRRGGWEGHRTAAAALLGYVVLRSVLLMTIDNSEPRYVLECYPVVFLLAARGLTRISALGKRDPASLREAGSVPERSG